MRSKKQWNDLFLLCLAGSLILGTAAVRTARSDYDEQEYGDESESDDYDNQYSNYGEEANTSASDNGSSIGCSVDTTTWAKNGETASATASADAWYMIDWTWDGPPGEAGATLSWSISVSGSVNADGANTISNPSTQSADSSAGADSDTSLSATEGSVDGGAWVSGSVEDDDEGIVDGDSDAGDYNPDPLDWGEQEEGEFAVYIYWDVDASVDTYYIFTYRYVYGDVECDCWSTAYASGSGAQSDSSADASASGSVSGSIDPW